MEQKCDEFVAHVILQRRCGNVNIKMITVVPPIEDRDHLFTFLDVEKKVFNKGLDDMKTILEELETEPLLQVAMIGGLQFTRRFITPCLMLMLLA